VTCIIPPPPRPFPTYETATTRYFYHGRTETVRSCTQEALNLAKIVVEINSSDNDIVGRRKLKILFNAAAARHNHLMDLGKKGMGCDRHLLGLVIAATEEGADMPEIFADPAYTKR
jgi:carnitine O-octanoyltransferase